MEDLDWDEAKATQQEGPLTESCPCFSARRAEQGKKPLKSWWQRGSPDLLCLTFPHRVPSPSSWIPGPLHEPQCARGPRAALELVVRGQLPRALAGSLRLPEHTFLSSTHATCQMSPCWDQGHVFIIFSDSAAVFQGMVSMPLFIYPSSCALH